jgi:hypothetical protein
MPLPPEVAKTIEYIDAQISSLTQAKSALLAAFGRNGNATGVDSKQMIIPQPVGATRRGALRNFILAHGPATRAQIAAGLPDFPEGTLAYYLNEKHGFRRNPNGLWELIEEQKQLAV